MFQQAALRIENPPVFEPIKAMLEATFAPAAAGAFLKHVEQAKFRVRDFEQVLERGLLGDAAKQGYAQLGDSDRGQVRELYLRLVEQVAPELRAKYRSVYVSY